MEIKYRSWMRTLLLALLICLSCQPQAPTQPSTAPSPQEPFIGITARLRPGVSSQPSSLDIELALPLGWIQEPIASIGLTFRDEEFRAIKGGYTAFIRQHVPGGFVDWPNKFPAEGDVLRAQYRVLLKHNEADPVVGIDEVPHPVANGWFLNGRAFIPYVSAQYKYGEPHAIDLPIRFTLTGENKQHLLSSVDPVIYEGSHEYQSDTMAGIRDALYVVGQPSLTKFSTSDVDVTIASSDFAGGDFNPLQTLIARTLSGGKSLLGEPNKKSFLLIYDKAEKRAGGVVGDGVSLLYSSVPNDLARSDVGVVLVHELIHLWNQADEDWLNEGLTRYAENLWSAKLDSLSPLEAWRLLQKVVESYQSIELDTTLRSSSGKLAYQGGATLFLCLDAQLRTEDLSLWELWREAKSISTQDRRIKASTFIEAIQKASPATAAQLQIWLDSKEHIDAAPCFASLGLRYDAVTKTLTPSKEISPIFP